MTLVKFDVVAWSAHALAAFLRITNRSLTIQVLGPAHSEQATQLLSAEFCRREPLCRLLGIKQPAIEGFFRQLVAYVAAQGLGIVAVDAAGDVRGVVTIEDHLAPFVPDPALVNADLEIINQLLDSLELPPALQPTAVGQVYYCGLAAVDSQLGPSPVLVRMILATFRHLQAKGYRRGYAKVTNGAIGKKFRKFERFFRSPIFSPSAEIRPAAFQYEGRQPFAGYRGAVCLFTWPMAFSVTPRSRPRSRS